MSLSPPVPRERAAAVRLLAIDVDGVLTDGLLYYTEEGEAFKAFHVRDGLGIRVLRHEGVEVAAISARRSSIVARRLQDLEVSSYFPGQEDKLAILKRLLEDTGVTAERAAFIGDDVLDLPALRHVGLPIAVADAHPSVCQEAAWVTRAKGGHGAVREVADALLTSQNRLESSYQALLERNQC